MTDQWNEQIDCPDCHKTGSASFTQGKGEDMPTATVSVGFKVVKGEYGPIFRCDTCDVTLDVSFQEVVHLI
jgi:hypothetical protein